MAMVLPVLALLTFGLLDFGRAYYFQVSITNAAREGARVAILNIYTGPPEPELLDFQRLCHLPGADRRQTSSRRSTTS